MRFRPFRGEKSHFFRAQKIGPGKVSNPVVGNLCHMTLKRGITPGELYLFDVIVSKMISGRKKTEEQRVWDRKMVLTCSR